jgi:hypothetical protein
VDDLVSQLIGVALDWRVARWSCGIGNPYGPGCYAPQGRASIFRRLAQEIDARTFDLNFPATLPEFVQHALWAFCAQDGLSVCNGTQIDDGRACENANCPVFETCGRVPLRPERRSEVA